MNLAVQTPPLRGVLVLGINVLERDGEVHVVEIEVINAPEGQLVLGNLLCARLLVEGVPELGSDDYTMGELMYDAFEGTL